MREDYIAHLVPLRKLVPGLTEQAYRLGLLGRDQAEDAIKEPARIFGYGYSTDCNREMLDELTKEGRFIEPSHVQIVCEELWTEYGQRLVDTDEKDKKSGLLAITIDQFNKLNGAGGILRMYFSECLEAFNPMEQLEALDILEPLITGSRTRNILERGKGLCSQRLFEAVR